MDEQHHLYWLGSAASIGAIVTSVAGFLPPIGALVAIIWYAIQIKESASVKNWYETRRRKKIARLRARVLELEAQILLEPETPEA